MNGNIIFLFLTMITMMMVEMISIIVFEIFFSKTFLQKIKLPKFTTTTTNNCYRSKDLHAKKSFSKKKMLQFIVCHWQSTITFWSISLLWLTNVVVSLVRVRESTTIIIIFFCYSKVQNNGLKHTNINHRSV